METYVDEHFKCHKRDTAHLEDGFTVAVATLASDVESVLPPIIAAESPQPSSIFEKDSALAESLVRV